MNFSRRADSEGKYAMTLPTSIDRVARRIAAALQRDAINAELEENPLAE